MAAVDAAAASLFCCVRGAASKSVRSAAADTDRHDASRDARSARSARRLSSPSGASVGQSSDCSYRGLLTHLNLTTTTDNLLKVMRPVRNWTTATVVQMDLLLYGILQVDEKSQTVTSHVWIQMNWMNEFLSWNPSDFCGIDSLCVPRTSLWIPDVAIKEDASDSGGIHNSQMVNLFFPGSVLATTRQRLTSTCHLNLKLFPFDTQRCNITFMSMTSNGKSIILGSYLNAHQLTNISEQFMVTRGEWDLEKLEIREFDAAGVKTGLVYTITITRKPMLYVIIFIVPLFYFVLLDVASFFINEARGEKLSFKVTVLLSISVLLLILKDLLPSTESSLPMIAMYCTGVFALVGLSLLEAMLVSFLIDLDGYCSSAKANDGAREDVQLEVDLHSEIDGAEGAPEKSSPPGVRLDDLLKLILEEVKTARQEVKGRVQEEKRPRRYRRLAEIIDIAFFILYFLSTCGFLTYMNIMWVSHLLLTR
ncbi:5-hydroxytryptamine receptor 3A-like [Clinocottus analis]|uniref:5-hydroxytryptamine receptor 3A-like n=1 Tax=Clinocottus analis TaxID=304258 RepID=UPI0035C01D5C